MLNFTRNFNGTLLALALAALTALLVFFTKLKRIVVNIIGLT